MFIECEKCQTKYEVSDSNLPTKGRKVKCASCGHIWYQAFGDELEQEESVEETVKVEEAVEEEVVEASEEQQEEVVVSEGEEAVAAEAEKEIEEVPAPEQEEAEEKTEEVLEEDTSDKAVADKLNTEVAPNSVKAFFAMVAMRARLLTSTFNSCAEIVKGGFVGVSGKTLLGGLKRFYINNVQLIFSLASCVVFMALTAFIAHSAKDIIVQKYPSAYLLYKTAGIEVKMPGEDLKIENFSAQYFKVRDGVNLKIKAEVTNRTSVEVKFPKINIVLKDADNAVLKTFTPEVGDKRVKPNKVYPFTLEFSDIPENSVVAEVVAVK